MTDLESRTVPPMSLTVSLAPETAAAVAELIRDTIASSLKETLTEPPLSRPTRREQPASEVHSASVSAGTELLPSDQLKAADLRTAVLLGKVPEGTGLLIDIKTLGQLLDVSERHVNRLIDLELVPKPIRLGRSLRWRLTEILEWIEADCPPQRSWLHERSSSRKARRK